MITYPRGQCILFNYWDSEFSSYKIYTCFDYKEPTPKECFVPFILLEMPHKHDCGYVALLKQMREVRPTKEFKPVLIFLSS